jgi:hypothetical protein
METQVRTPQAVFNQPQRLIVPLFQRPYVWTEDIQWEPLWSDVVRGAQRLINTNGVMPAPHFLGAVVLQQLQNPTGQMQMRTIIDGQQRLTTLQLLIDALHGELVAAGADHPAMRLEPLVKNSDAFCQHETDKYKVWPTNRDQDAYNEVMGAKKPVAYGQLLFNNSRIVSAHRYFAQKARDWLKSGDEDLVKRADCIERTVRELIQLVVIELTADENAQEIFETLNARGTPLTAADLIKNFIFQKLLDANKDVQIAYENNWKHFESGFWEEEISAGRVKQQRSSIFINQWLIAKTGEEILAREVFYRFKEYAIHEADASIDQILTQLHRAGDKYKEYVKNGEQLEGTIDRLGLFSYRTSVMESEIVKPLVLFLIDPNDSQVPQDQLIKALDVIESWLVRRMLVRVTSKSYSQVVAELIQYVRKKGRFKAGDCMEDYLRKQTANNWYWPDDNEVRSDLMHLPAYKKLSKARVRMILEAVEDYERGWRGQDSLLDHTRVARKHCEIEHIMPQSWQENWSLANGENAEDRDGLVNTLGNLTLLTKKLNKMASNSQWSGPQGKRRILNEHDNLMLNKRLLEMTEGAWDEALIRKRSGQIISAILAIWAVPAGHKSQGMHATNSSSDQKVNILDLINSGMLKPGSLLYPKGKKYKGQTATVLSNGMLEVDGIQYKSPSGAASSLTNSSVNGLMFWLVDEKTKVSIKDVAQEYIDQGGEGDEVIEGESV